MKMTVGIPRSEALNIWELFTSAWRKEKKGRYINAQLSAADDAFITFARMRPLWFFLKLISKKGYQITVSKK